jgi:hypothetical protein
MIKVKLVDLVAAEGALLRLSKERLRLREAYDVEKRMRAIRPELTWFHEKREEMIRNLGKDKGDGAYEIKQGSENFKVFQDEMKELLDKDIELAILPLSINILGDKEIPVEDVRALFWLFDEIAEGEA